MFEKITYILLLGWAKANALLPFRVLYLISDFLYFLIYKVIRYRVKVVRRNMKASFPEKNEKELLALEKEFYHHFADYIIETIKLAHISEKEIQKRAYVKNPELIDDLIDKGYSTFIAYMGHYGNWEWYTGSTSRFKDCHIHQIYRPLSNKAVDKLFVYLRTRFGSFGIKKNDAFRDIVRLKQNKVHTLVIFIADQTPSRGNLQYWTSFLNQGSFMLTGAERIARKLNLPVIFLDVQKVKRGYYSLEIKLITETPKETPEYWLTEEYTRIMEKCIMRNPAYWLWTHKRWKYNENDKNS